MEKVENRKINHTNRTVLNDRIETNKNENVSDYNINNVLRIVRTDLAISASGHVASDSKM